MALVWLIVAVVTVEVLVTYSRLPAHELYHVSRSGFGGGASRALVLLNFPVALVAIAILLVLAERLPRSLASAGLVLSAAVLWPGVVKQSDLDARPVNAVAAVGVAIAAALSIVAWRRGGLAPLVPRRSGDRGRAVLALAALLAAVPWLAADLGFSFDGVPLLGTLYQTGELRREPGDPVLHPAVHHGHHHGMDGVVLVLAAVLLSRLLPAVVRPWLRGVSGAYLALMICYGAANIANDFWLEQVVKRGWTDWEIPGVTEPRLSVAWGVIVASAAALWLAGAWRARRNAAPGAAGLPTAP